MYNGQETGKNIKRVYFTKARNEKERKNHHRNYKVPKGEQTQMEMKCIMESIKWVNELVLVEVSLLTVEEKNQSWNEESKEEPMGSD